MQYNDKSMSPSTTPQPQTLIPTAFTQDQINAMFNQALPLQLPPTSAMFNQALPPQLPPASAMFNQALPPQLPPASAMLNQALPLQLPPASTMFYQTLPPQIQPTPAMFNQALPLQPSTHPLMGSQAHPIQLSAPPTPQPFSHTYNMPLQLPTPFNHAPQLLQTAPSNNFRYAPHTPALLLQPQCDGLMMEADGLPSEKQVVSILLPQMDPTPQELAPLLFRVALVAPQLLSGSTSLRGIMADVAADARRTWPAFFASITQGTAAPCSADPMAAQSQLMAAQQIADRLRRPILFSTLKTWRGFFVNL